MRGVVDHASQLNSRFLYSVPFYMMEKYVTFVEIIFYKGLSKNISAM
jgi:hypothetical protein